MAFRKAILSVLFMLPGLITYGQLVTYPLTENGEPDSVSDYIHAGEFSQGPDLRYTHADKWGFGEDGSTLKYWPENGLQEGAYFQISIAPESGKRLQVSALRFGERRSGSGIRNYCVRYAYNSLFTNPVTIDSAEVPDNTEERNHELTGLDIPVEKGDTLYFRWYGYNSKDSSFGRWCINDNSLRLMGSVGKCCIDKAALTRSFIQQGQEKAVYCIKVTPDKANIHLDSLSCEINGSFNSGDIDQINCYLSNDSTYDAGDTPVDSITSVNQPSENIFNDPDISFDAGESKYLVLTAELAPDATIGDSLFVGQIQQNDLHFASDVVFTCKKALAEGNSLKIAQSGSSSSDIVVNETFTYPGRIGYIDHRESSLTDSSLKIASFDLRDGGANNDSDTLATFLHSMTVKIQHYKMLNKIGLWRGRDKIREKKVRDSTFFFSDLQIHAPDNSIASLQFKASFGDSIVENRQVAVSVTQAQTKERGSQFASENAAEAKPEISDTENIIEVNADSLQFISGAIPEAIGINDACSIKARALDSLSNIDINTDFRPDLEIEHDEGDIQYLQDSVVFDKGIYTWPEITFDTGGAYVMEPISSEFHNAVSDTIYALPPLSYDSFADGELLHDPYWYGDHQYFTVSDGELQSQGPEESENEIFVSTGNQNYKNQEWRFDIDLNFNPTSYNIVRVYLSSGNHDLTEPLNGYFLEIGETSEDKIEFYRQHKDGTITKLFCGMKIDL